VHSGDAQVRAAAAAASSMEDLYSIHPGISRAGGAASEASVAGVGGPAPSDLTELMKAQIASHPRYPSLLSAYIECRKVRASTACREILRGSCACQELIDAFSALRGCVVYVRAVS
jgi:hypothetical protein